MASPETPKESLKPYCNRLGVSPFVCPQLHVHGHNMLFAVPRTNMNHTKPPLRYSSLKTVFVGVTCYLGGRAGQSTPKGMIPEAAKPRTERLQNRCFSTMV